MAHVGDTITYQYHDEPADCMNVIGEDDWSVTRQSGGNLTIFKYHDLDGNGVYDGADYGLDGWHFSVSSGISWEGDTSGGGFIFLTDLVPGNYTVVEHLTKKFWRNTDPGPPAPIMETVEVLANATAYVDFGNKEYTPSVPAAGQWGIGAMIALFGASLVWVARRRKLRREHM